MSIQITICEDNAEMALYQLRTLAASVTVAQQPAPEAANVSSNDLHNPPAAEPVEQPRKPRGKKADKPEVIEGTARQVDIEEVTGTGKPANDAERMLTVDDVRELTRQWTKENSSFMDDIAAEMTARGVKKMSDIDPDAGGKPSAKFGAYATAIEARIAARKAAAGSEAVSA